jgi:hypothetical protein
VPVSTTPAGFAFVGVEGLARLDMIVVCGGDDLVGVAFDWALQ